MSIRGVVSQFDPVLLLFLLLFARILFMALSPLDPLLALLSASYCVLTAFYQGLEISSEEGPPEEIGAE